MSIILSWGRRLFSWSFNELIFRNNSRWNGGFSLYWCLFDIVCTNWWIGVRFPNILTTDSHIFCVVSEIFKMPIIFTWSRRLFRSFFLEKILGDDCWRNRGFSLNEGLIYIICANRRIRIWFPFIFSPDCHIVLVISEFFQMSIILTRCRWLFFWSLRILIDFYDSWRYSWFGMTDSLINIICPNRRIWIWFPFIFSTNCHVVRIESEICQMCIVLARSG